MPPKKKISKPAKVSLKRKAEVLSGSDNERPDDKPHSGASEDDFVVDDEEDDVEVKIPKPRLIRKPERYSTPVESTSNKRTKHLVPILSKALLSEDDDSFIPSPIYDTPARKLRKDLNSKTPTKSAVKGASGLQSPSKATPASAKRRIYAGPTSDEDSAADVADSDGDDADDFDTPEKNKKRQDTYNQAIAEAKKEMKMEVSLKGKKAEQKLEPLTEKTVYYADMGAGPSVKKFLPRPSKCAVINKGLIDPLLKRTYDKLGKLHGGQQNIGWKTVEVLKPMLGLSEVKELYPHADIEYFIRLITFTMDRKTNVINLSRVAYEDLKMAKPTLNSSSQMVFLDGQTTPALCVCFASVEEDKLQTAEGIYPTKSLHAIPHKQEYEFKVANLCHLLGVPFIRSQIVDNFLAFTTRPGGTSNEGQGSKEQSSLGFTSSTSTPRKSALTRGIASPANVTGSIGDGVVRSTSRYSLSANDVVPVFDGRHHKIDLPAGLRNVPRSKMPLFPGEIPYDAVVLIGYSTAAYRALKTPDDMSVSFNIVWVVVLASKDP